MVNRFLTLVCISALSGSLLVQVVRAQTVEDLPQLIKDVAAGDAPRAVPAAEKLARLGEAAQPATETLVGALHSNNVQLRVAAAQALEAIGPGAAPATPALIAMLEDRNLDRSQGKQEARVYAASALAAIGPAAVPAMIQALDPKKTLTYEGVCTALHKMGADAAEAVPSLIALVEKNDENVIAPIFAIQGIGPPAKSAIPALIKTLDHSNFHAQYFACRALGAMGPEGQPAVEKLIERLKNGVTSVRRNAAVALGQISTVGGEASLQALLDALNDPLQPVRVEALVSLGKFGPEAAVALPKIKEMLADNHFVGKSQAAGALYRINPDEQDYAMEVLLAQLQGDNAPWDAAKELGEIAPRTNRVAEIIQLLDNEREETREFAAEALGYMGVAAQPALERLQTMANDEQQPQDVRTAAREAILRIAAPQK